MQTLIFVDENSIEMNHKIGHIFQNMKKERLKKEIKVIK